MIVALDHLAHSRGFVEGQASWDEAWAARLIIEVASSLGAAPAVVARCREASGSKRGVERQDVPRPRDRSQEDSFGVAVWKSLVIELDLRCSKHRDQKADDRSKQSGSASESFDLCGQLGTITGGEIAGDYVRHTAVNPASNG
jgi:hypothetical protein